MGFVAGLVGIQRYVFPLPDAGEPWVFDRRSFLAVCSRSGAAVEGAVGGDPFVRAGVLLEFPNGDEDSHACVRPSDRICLGSTSRAK